MPRRHDPLDVIPARVAAALAASRVWFVIGGHAVRCFCPYRPSNDVDLGVPKAGGLRALLSELERRGRVEILERNEDTVHLRFDGIDASIFVLPVLAPFEEGHALTAEALVATKLHAILDRGTRRDFFDLYVMMQQERLGLVECFRAIRAVYATDVNEGLLLRAISYFDDAEAEAPLPGEGRDDWRDVRAFFAAAAGALVVPPPKPLAIQKRVVDVRARGAATRAPAIKRRGKKR